MKWLEYECPGKVKYGLDLYAYKTEAVFFPRVPFAWIIEKIPGVYKVKVMNHSLLNEITGLENAKRVCERELERIHSSLGEQIDRLEERN